MFILPKGSRCKAIHRTNDKVRLHVTKKENRIPLQYAYICTNSHYDIHKTNRNEMFLYLMKVPQLSVGAANYIVGHDGIRAYSYIYLFGHPEKGAKYPWFLLYACDRPLLRLLETSFSKWALESWN